MSTEHPYPPPGENHQEATNTEQAGKPYAIPVTNLLQYEKEKDFAIPFFGRKAYAQRLVVEKNALIDQANQLNSVIERYRLKSLADLELAQATLQKSIEEQQASWEKVNHSQTKELEQLHQKIKLAKADLLEAQVREELEGVGLYRYHHPAENSTHLKEKLEQTRSSIKSLVKSGHAVSATENFTFNKSAAQGRRFVTQMSKLLLRAYNAEAENCVKSVKAGNLAVAKKRLEKSKEQIQKLGTMIDLEITTVYHRQRMRELELASDYHMKVKQEREEERARREELREQRRAEQEIERERQKLEKERQHHLNALAALIEKGETEAAERMKAALTDVEDKVAQIESRAANIRAGYVYVISNIGSFGETVVKIGMTRRLEPMDRVRELGDASVPFRFDVHTLFFSEDAVGVEAALHRHFKDRRVNKVNMRKEYFYATPHEVKEALTNQAGEVLEFVEIPEAEEYRLGRGEVDAII